MQIVAISDTHERHRLIDLPEGDVLIHAGDITMKGSLSALKDFADWFGQQPHPHKLAIAGNHDFCFENQDSKEAEQILKEAGITYLCDSGVTIDGAHFWGSPWQPWFFDWAFNLARGQEIAEKWALIPDNTNVLITHGPPNGISDLTIDGVHAGCEALADRIGELRQLRAHVFGHIHEGYGSVREGRMIYANACSCDLRYRPVNPPLAFSYPKI